VPELIRDRKFTNKSGIWALGCIFYVLIFRKKAFSLDAEVHDYALCGKAISVPEHSLFITGRCLQSFVAESLRDTLETDPGRRPSAELLEKRFRDVFPSCERVLQPFMLSEELTIK